MSEEDEGHFATKSTNMLQKVAKRFSIHAGKKMRCLWIGSEAISRLTCMFSTAVHSTWQKPPLATTAPRLDRGPPLLLSLLLLLLHQRDPTWPPEGARTAVGGHQRPTKANEGQHWSTINKVTHHFNTTGIPRSMNILLNCLTASSY